MVQFVDLDNAKIVQKQNITISNEITKMKGDSNIYNQKYYYQSSSRIYTAYIILILKYIYTIVCLILLVVLLTKKELSFYIKLGIVIVIAIYPFLIPYFHDLYIRNFPRKNN